MEVSVNSVKIILKHLWRLQELDRKMLGLRGNALSVASFKDNQVGLNQIRLKESEKKRELDDLRLVRNQTRTDLELCRERLNQVDSFNEIDQLKKLEKTLELKRNRIEKDTDTILGRLEDLQKERLTIELEFKRSEVLDKPQDDEIETTVREIETQKIPVLSLIPPKYLFSYQKIAGTRNGIGMAKVDRNSCGECNVVLPAQMVNEILSSRSVEYCPNCKRILVASSIEMDC